MKHCAGQLEIKENKTMTEAMQHLLPQKKAAGSMHLNKLTLKVLITTSCNNILSFLLLLFFFFCCFFFFVFFFFLFWGRMVFFLRQLGLIVHEIKWNFKPYFLWKKKTTKKQKQIIIIIKSSTAVVISPLRLNKLRLLQTYLFIGKLL